VEENALSHAQFRFFFADEDELTGVNLDFCAELLLEQLTPARTACPGQQIESLFSVEWLRDDCRDVFLVMNAGDEVGIGPSFAIPDEEAHGQVLAPNAIGVHPLRIFLSSPEGGEIDLFDHEIEVVECAPPAICGDGHVDAGEECDEGELNADQSSASCNTECGRLSPRMEVSVAQDSVVICETGALSIQIQNTGNGDLIIDQLQLDQDSWSHNAQLPLRIEPGTSATVEVLATPGSSTLSIHSNAHPDSNPHRITLTAIADQPPVASILSPQSALIINEGEDAAVIAQVADDQDAPNALSITLTSSNGAIDDQGSADAQGAVDYNWRAQDRGVASQTLTLTVTDSCGQSATTTLSICQQSESKTLAVWIAPPEGDALLDENFIGEIVSYSGDETSVENYDYYSASAHPHVGPTPTGFESNVFFYEGTDGLTLNFFSNLDNSGSQSWTDVDWDINISGNETEDSVLLSDDPGEVNRVSIDENGSAYEVRLTYVRNTDGGIIGPFAGERFKISVDVLESGDTNTALFHSADGSSFPLMVDDTISSFIVSFMRNESCQID
jgi:hypothetical protein